jgi:hypothetical protein
MTDCKCSKTDKSTKICVEENGKAAIFLNPEKEIYTKIKIDGCILKNTTACDFCVERRGTDGVLIELKGRDVSHAIDQIEATLAYLAFNKKLRKRVAAIIVCSKPSQHPAFTAKLQRAKQRLSKKYNAPLHIFREKYEGKMDAIFSYKIQN